jgi:threonine/homoserine/homoserine lactone efflux protein
MDIVNFIFTVVLVTASGALAPGPLFFATISHGTRSGAKGGLWISVGHTLIEFPLVLLLASGLLTAYNQPIVQLVVGVVGGVALLVFSALQIRNAFKTKSDDSSLNKVKFRSPLLLGLGLSGLNPFFIIWWLTVGMALILEALALASLAGIVLMYISHVWMDYAWLILTAHFAHMGRNLVGTRGYRVLMIFFGTILIYFGLTFLLEAFKLLLYPPSNKI